MRSDWLDAFLIFSDSMNFTHAAEALHISQPALHVKIGKLADSLGQPLYRKVGRNLVLTPAGERVAAYARDQRERASAFIQELRTGETRWPVVLCAGTGAYLYLLGPAISEFVKQSRHPLHLVTGDRDRAVDLVLSGEAHLGVTVLDAVPRGVVSRTLTDVEQILVVPRTHRLAQLPKAHLSDLENESLIVPPQNRPHRTMLNNMLMDAGVSWHVAVEAGGWELMLHFVALGVGLAIVNGCCRVPPQLAALPLKGLPRVRYQVIQRAEGGSHEGATALIQSLLAHAGDWRRGS